MKPKNIFNAMGFAGRLGKLGDILENICERIDKLEKKIEALSEKEGDKGDA